MQFIDAKPLIEKYRSGTFQEAEVAPYFMGYLILIAIATGFAVGDMDLWSVVSGFASIVITIMGVLHLKRQNNDTFGNGFLSKYFSLGWIISIRMLLLAFPTVFVILAFVSNLGNDAEDAAGTVFTIVFEILFYWWLGVLFAESNQIKSAQAVIDQPLSAA